jgi:hypothetical protein
MNGQQNANQSGGNGVTNGGGPPCEQSVIT